MKLNHLPIRLGVIGGGQLAQMLALSARQIGVLPVILAQKPTDCALQVVHDFVLDDGSDLALESFSTKVDLITIENEFLDLDRFEKVSDRVFPRVETLRLIQSKLDQKNFLKKNKLPTLDFIKIEQKKDFEEA